MTAIDSAARAARERELYNEGLERETYASVLSHADYLYRKLRQERLVEIMRPADGGRVLELGSNSWYRCVEELGYTPASLTCINISERELEKGIAQGARARLSPQFRIMDAHQLEFPDASLDLVFGVAILHHLDLERALSEVRRVLVPGGRCYFVEPLDNNPMGRIVRALTPGARTEEERPFRRRDMNLVQVAFPNARFGYEQFFSVPLGVLSRFVFRDEPDNTVMRNARRIDEALLRFIPKLGPYFRLLTITAEKV